MYRLLMCYRYVMSRFLTLVATLGVFLGVMALIVVMAVMSGFQRDVRDACRGSLSDVIIVSDVSGFPYYDQFIEEIKKNPNVVEATPVVQLYALARMEPDPFGPIVRQCVVYGVRPEALSKVSRFREFLERQKDAPADVAPTFDLRPEDARPELYRGATPSGCIPGNELVTYYIQDDDQLTKLFKKLESAGKDQKDESQGVPRPETMKLTPLGAPLRLTTLPVTSKGTLGSGAATPIMRTYAVVDYYKSRLYEFDSKYIFIPFEDAQKLGALGDLTLKTPEEEMDSDDPPRAHQIRVALKDYSRAQETIADLKARWAVFAVAHPKVLYKDMVFQTWEEQTAGLLSVVNMQLVIMVFLLGLIIAVAGFLIGAVLTMIVKEKTRDIGILKCLGASNSGVARIFLYYAAFVSSVGAILGLLVGKLFIFYIDGIESMLSRVLGIDVFPRRYYYFDHIPRYEDPWLEAAVVAGAILCAIACSVIAAWRAARLQPVEALRYE